VTRSWNEFIGHLGGLLIGGVPMLAFLSLIATILVALAAYFWPSWLPRNWNLRGQWRGSRDLAPKRRRRRLRLGALRWRWRLAWRRRRKTGRLDGGDELPADELPDIPVDELPDLPTEVLLLTADQLAAAGRYRESVRERLRAILCDLTDRGILPISPGWTLTELATFATQARPPLAPPLRAAVDVFSEIWYGLRPAHVGDDARLRAAADEVTRLLAEPVAATAPGATR
jgi:hypothetical protein